MFRSPDPYSDFDSDSENPSVRSYVTASVAASVPVPVMDLDLATPIAPNARHILPALREFNGDRAVYPTWRATLRAKLRVDGERMGGPYGQIATILMALKGNAERVCAPFLVKLLENDAATAQDVVDYMDRIFQDPALQQHALELWGRLRQGTSSFDAFYADFERLLAEAGGETFDERVKMAQLRRATSNEVVKIALAGEDATSLDELSRRYRKIAVGLADLKGPGVVYASPLTSIAAPHAYYAPMDIDVPGSFPAAPAPVPNRAAPQPKTRVNPDGGRGPGLSNDDLLRGRVAKWVSVEEIKRRKSAGTCLRCNRRGCKVAICPLSAARRPSPPAPSRAYVATLSEPDYDAESVCEPGPATEMSKN